MADLKPEPTIWQSARGFTYVCAAWVAWRVFRNRKRMVDWAARGEELLWPNRKGMVKSGPYAKEFGND